MDESGPAHKAPEGGAVVSGEQPTMPAGTPQLQSGVPDRVRGHPSPAAVDRTPSGRVSFTGREVAGRYAIMGQLGEGGMGMVYEAEHVGLKKRVAFKVIHPELARLEELMLRFKREALATGQLDHPHIASAFDFGELDDGGAFMVMPLVRGASLAAAIEAGERMPLRRAALICAQIADALSAAHSVGIVHRDLKPDNVMVEQRADGSEFAKVLDFGVASLAGGGAAAVSLAARPLTQAGTILGTPGYMSPEQATAGEIDQRTDLYALGVMLWELIRGERLFDGSDVTAIFAKQFREVPPALELGGSAAARELSTLVAALLDWDKAKRPSSAAEVRDTLRRIAEQPDLTLERAVAAPDLLRRYWPHAVAVLALILAFVGWMRDDDVSEPEAAPVLAPTTEPAPTRKEPAPTRKEPPQPSLRVSRGEKPVDTELLATLFEGARQQARRSAARDLLEHEGELPVYVALSAKFELSERCSERKDILAALDELGDPRVLPMLRRLSEQRRSGCGFLRLSDCLACLRRELDQAIGKLDAVGK